MDIFDVNESLVKVLCKTNKILEYSKEFKDIPSNHGKVNYIENLLVQYKQILALELRVDLRANKNDNKSLEFRKEGNKFFSLNNKDYYKAVELYNKSICFAEEGSENLAIGYANRSAILFEWKRYTKCLENIRLAREANYPERLKHKLDEREKKCLELLENDYQETPPYDFKLAFPAHEKIPYISNCLQMKSNEEEGRFIYTEKDLEPGDLVAAEDPFCTLLLPESRYRRCANCTSENVLTLIPCPDCTSAMFCTEKCLAEGMETFHKYECPIIDFLFALFNKIHLIALRVCLVAMSQFECIDDLEAFCEQPCNQNKSAFDLNYENFTKKECYRAVHGLVTNQEKRSTADLFQRGVMAAVLKRFIFNRTPLKEVLHTVEHVNFFTDLLFRHLQTAPSNMHSMSMIEQSNDDDFTFGSAAYPFASLLNHSCAPNTVRIYQGTRQLLFITRPIPAGGVLYDNYGYHFANEHKDIRIKKLLTQYHFQCNCEACEKNYPFYINLKNPPEVPVIFTKHIDSLSQFNRAFAEDNFSIYTKMLSTYTSFYPCMSLNAYEECLKMALNILVDAIPLKIKVANL